MTLLKMSLTGAVLILLVALIRQLAQGRIPKGIFPLLWGVVLIRLLIPFPALLPVSLPFAEAFSARTGEARVTPDPLLGAEPTPEPDGAKETIPAYLDFGAAELDMAKAAPDLLTPVWLGGGCLTGLVFLCLYAHGRRRFRAARPLSEEESAQWRSAHPLRRGLRLRVLPGLSVPITYGLLRPTILLPAELDLASPQAAFALEHEYMHVRRLDALWKLLLTLALTVHWFNPAVWLLWLLANRDLELSCDEAVLRRLGGDARSAYALALVDLAAGGSRSPALSFGGGSAEKRVRAIMTYRRSGLLRRVCAWGLVLCLALCALGGVEIGADYTGRKVYRNGGLTLTVPAELADLVLVQTPAVPAEQSPEGDVVFRVLERESWDLGQELHPGEDRGDGLAFLILRESEDEALKVWTKFGYSHDLIARWEDGTCYSLVYPTFHPPTGGEKGLDTRSERWKRWLLVFEWANAIRENLSRDNPDLTVYRGGSTLLARFLGGALFGEESYTLRMGEEGRPYDLMSIPGAEEQLRDLVWHSASEYCSYRVEQEGTPLLLAREDGDTLYFWRGSERVLYRSRYMDSNRYNDILAAFLDGREGTVSDALWAWYESVMAAG